MCAGTREDGSLIEANDPMWDALQNTALAAKTNPQAWLEQSKIYGDLAQSQPFSDAFCGWLEMLWEQGCEATLNAYIDPAQANLRVASAL